MFIEYNLTAILFRLFNFGLIVALITYAFRQYVIPAVMMAMTKKESEKEYLLSEQLRLEQRLFELDRDIKKDVLRCEQLKVRVETWKHSVEVLNSLYREECLKREATVQSHKLKKIRLQAEALVKTHIAKSVVSELELSLSDYFKNNKVSEQYIADITNFMDKRLL